RLNPRPSGGLSTGAPVEGADAAPSCEVQAPARTAHIQVTAPSPATTRAVIERCLPSASYIDRWPPRSTLRCDRSARPPVLGAPPSNRRGRPALADRWPRRSSHRL